MGLSGCPLCFESLKSFITLHHHSSSSTAYQLRVCQAPPEVANADALMEDNEFEIGRIVFLLFRDWMLFLPDFRQAYRVTGRSGWQPVIRCTLHVAVSTFELCRTISTGLYMMHFSQYAIQFDTGLSNSIFSKHLRDNLCSHFYSFQNHVPCILYLQY